MTECPNPSWCEINSCNGNCKKDPYGVPTGYVPRRDHYAEALDRSKQVGVLIDRINGCPPTSPTDSEILASVRAFIALHGKHGYVDVDTIRRLVHPAPNGTSIENEKLVDDYRARRAQSPTQPADPTASDA